MKKTILVTGAAVRIGREIALTFAKDGWNIIIHCNSSTEKAEALAKEIEEKFDSSAKVVQANLDKDDHVENQPKYLILHQQSDIYFRHRRHRRHQDHL